MSTIINETGSADQPSWEFDRATAVHANGESRYRGEVVDGWDINGNANGGYLMAMAVRAMLHESGRSDPCSVTCHFLAPGRPGPVEIETEAVKAGKLFSTVSASMASAEGRTMLRLIGAFGDAPAAGSIADTDFAEIGAPALPPIDECEQRGRSQSEVDIALMDRVRVALDPMSAAFQHGAPAGDVLAAAGRHRAEMTGWITFADGRPWDTLALMVASDCFPPAVFQLDLPFGWVPTVELTVQVRGRPAPGPLQARFTTRFVRGSYFEEDGEIWDSAGELVALSRQFALVAKG